MHRTLRGSLVALLFLAAGSAVGAPLFKLYDPGTEDIVDYEKYGEFLNLGTKDFRYVIKDRDGLARASGEGIDPSLTITNNPEYRKALKANKLKGDWWKNVGTSNPQLDYFVWAHAPEDPGVRLLYVGKAMERGGYLMHALKAYRAAMILYPDSACWSSGSEFQWDVATAAWNAIQNLLRKHPELNLRLVDADVVSRADSSGLNIIVRPGKLERIPQPAPVAAEEVEKDADDEQAEAVEDGSDTNAVAAADTNAQADVKAPAPLDPSAEVMHRGTGTVQLVQYGDGSWKMFVDGEPHFIYGMNYAPVRVGVKPWEWNWMWSDENTNGIVDSFEVWVDENRNNKQDDDEPLTTDYELMKKMGVNTIKFYVTDAELPCLNTMLLRRMFKESGIRAIVGNFLGAYCNGSGANWARIS